MSPGSRTIKVERLYRTAIIDRAAQGAIDEEARRVHLAFSSEEPYERWFGVEVLDHGRKSVRMDFMASGRAPILVDHRTGEHVGVIEEASIDADRKGRLTARFGRGVRASEIFTDIVDGIRQNVSVGYRVHRMVLEEEVEDGPSTYRVVDWEPLEASVVPIPADTTVGVGRAESGEREYEVEIVDRKSKEETMEPDEDKNKAAGTSATTDPGNTPPQVDVNRIREDANKAERARVAEIMAVAKKHPGIADLANEHVGKGTSWEEFSRLALESISGGEVTRVTDLPDIGMNEREREQFSFLRAIRALAFPKERKWQEEAAFEFDASRAAADKAGREPQGIMIPHDVLAHPVRRPNTTYGMPTRDLSVGVDTAGGYTVGTNLMPGSFIDLLRNRLALERAGIRVMSGLLGDVAIPKQTGAGTGYWISTEGGAPTENQQTLGQVGMTPRTVGAFTDFTRQLVLQSSMDVEGFVRMDLAKVLALMLDMAGLYGTGADGQPTGLANVTGLNSVTFAAADPTYAEVVDVETQIAADNADVDTMSYITDAAMRGAFKTTEKASNTAQFIWEPGNTVNGYPCIVSNQVTDGDLWFGNWDDLVLGMWGGMDLTVDPFTHSTSGTVRVVVLQSADYANRHAESFCLGNDG